MRLNKKKNKYEEPVDMICNYIYNIEEIKDNIIKNNIIRYDMYEEPVTYDDDLVNWMCSFRTRDFI